MSSLQGAANALSQVQPPIGAQPANLPPPPVQFQNNAPQPGPQIHLQGFAPPSQPPPHAPRPSRVNPGATFIPLAHRNPPSQPYSYLPPLAHGAYPSIPSILYVQCPFFVPAPPIPLPGAVPGCTCAACTPPPTVPVMCRCTKTFVDDAHLGRALVEHVMLAHKRDPVSIPAWWMHDYGLDFEQRFRLREWHQREFVRGWYMTFYGMA